MKTRISQSTISPKPFEYNSGIYYVRTDIIKDETKDPVMYNYQETQYDETEYLVYLGEQTRNMNLDLSAVMEAIVDIYSIIGGE